MNKKIIISTFDSINNPFYGGGGALAVHEIAKRLAKSFKVLVLAGRYSGSEKKEKIDGIQYERIGSSFGGPKLNQLLFHYQLMRQIKKRQFDLWLENFTPPFSTSFLPCFTTRPVIGLVHMLSGEEMNRKYHLPFDLIEKNGLKYYKQIVVTSEFFKKKIGKLNPAVKISVIPNGVNAKKMFSQKKTGNYILFLGRLELDQKGIDLLLQAFNLIKNETRLTLVIAGSGRKTELQNLDLLIKQLQLQDRVKLGGKISGANAKNAIFKNATCCIVPSRFETFSLVALEAMASGTPVIAFDIDGLKWIPAEAILKVPAFNLNLLARAMIKIINNTALRNELAQKGKELARRYDWNLVAGQYENLINNTLQR